MDCDSTDIPATLTRAAEEKKKGYKKKLQDRIPKDSPSTTKTATVQAIREIPSDLLKKPVETKTVSKTDGEPSSISSVKDHQPKYSITVSHNSELNISEGDLIPSPTTQYLAQKYLGNGAYGMVIQCRNVTTGETVALKIIESLWDIDYAQVEEVILQNMKKLNSDRFNIVRLYESFFYKEHYCLVFELLDMDLQKFKRISPGQHLQLKQIRPILQQLATALDFLNSTGIIHADLKPDNIMLVDHVRQPLKVKVIDFGISFDDPEEMLGQNVQTLWYRAPEILYQDHFSGKIDVWSLGCIAAELSMGKPLFRSKDEDDLMGKIAVAQRDPRHEGNLLPHAFWPRSWMEGRFMGDHPVWFQDVQAEFCDLQCFMDLMTQMLMMSQYKRITPGRILQHPFITMSHLQGSYKNSLYLKSCKDLMDICQDQSSEDGGH
ncbi:homeodomain-interacting protein kinase 1-like [Pleuronectes platessa]|uniref:homeodomain-interacting protein kinase 1-like n=3 Tax=Pleuronectes platessa TaxID=8262 RepID=UPI00232A26C9|nr:homeodomain-interacting protein kinase 1-like [Pleuronectes platessa]